MARDSEDRDRDEDHDPDEELFPEGAECHGLFLPETERDKPISVNAIGRISVKRIHPFEETAPSTFGPNDLRSPADLQERWGGGVYQVTARRHDGTILPGAHRRHTMQGKAFAFAAGARERAEAADAATADPMGMGKNVDPTIAIMLATLERMSSQQNAVMERMAKDQDAARKEASAFMLKAIEVLGNAKAPAQLATIGGNGAGDEKSVDHFRAGMAYAFDQVSEWRKDKKGESEGEDEGDEQKTIQTIVEGIKAARDLSKD